MDLAFAHPRALSLASARGASVRTAITNVALTSSKITCATARFVQLYALA